MAQQQLTRRRIWEQVLAPVRVIPEAYRSKVGIVLVAILALLFPLIIPNAGDVDAAANALAFAILALGLNIVVGFAGLLDLGYAAFFAIGAYGYGIVASWQFTPPWSSFWEPFQWLGLVSHTSANLVHFTPSFWLMMPITAAVAAVFGVLFGYPTLRLKGDYLAIVTLGFGEIVPIVVRNTPSVTSGAMGLTGVESPQLFGYHFGVHTVPYYYLGLAMLAFLLFVSMRLRDSRIGRAWMAIREDEVAAGAMGVDRRKLKLLAFATGAAFAGATGTFYVAKLQTASPEMFMFPVSVMVLVMVVLGGMGSVWGVIVGALILQLLQSWLLQDLTQWLNALGRLIDSGWLAHIQLVQSMELIFGIILVFMMLYRREGLIPASRPMPSLSLLEQTASPSRGGMAASLSGLGKVDLPAGQPVMEISNLVKHFGGIKALNGVDVKVMPHTVVGVIGPNGSGKTTLFNLITGMDQPTSGTVSFVGGNITGLESHKIVDRGVARTFQNLRLFNNLTVLENVLVGMHSRTSTGMFGAVGRPPRVKNEEAASREWALEVLSVFGNRLLPRVNHMASSLSYANRRRLEIARAVASRPKILLLDEPTAGMNPAETLELADQIKSLREMGLTILLIEHKLNVINNIADRVVVLDHGVKIAEGTAAEVQRNEDVIEAYLGRTATASAV